VPSLDDAINGAHHFVDNVLPLVTKENAAYQRRDARLSGLELGR
jgi:hypothetical protein